MATKKAKKSTKKHKSVSKGKKLQPVKPLSTFSRKAGEKPLE